jgi:hypothetical protein
LSPLRSRQDEGWCPLDQGSTLNAVLNALSMALVAYVVSEVRAMMRELRDTKTAAQEARDMIKDGANNKR